jgi:hypothetical protein
MTRKMFSVSSEFLDSDIFLHALEIDTTLPWEHLVSTWENVSEVGISGFNTLCASNHRRLICPCAQWWTSAIGRSHSYIVWCSSITRWVSVKYFLIDSYTSTSRPWGSSMTTIVWSLHHVIFSILQSVSTYGRRFRPFLIWSALGVVPRGLCM